MGKLVLETFVVVHEQERLLAAEAEGRYRHLPEPRFLFVGDRPAERLTGREDVVVARDLPYNLEHRPNLLAFTAWFAVARNGLGRAPNVAMLEYDIDVGPDFVATTHRALEESSGALVGYEPMPFSDPRYSGVDVPVASSLRRAYGIELDAFVTDRLQATGQDLWTATSNLSLSRRTLEAFVDWYLPIAETFGDDPLGAHVHERCIPVFGHVTERETVYVPDVLSHRQERSHGIEIARRLHRPAGARRLLTDAADPDLSVVVAARGDEERVVGTVRSLAPERQVGWEDGAVEIIVVDNGSRPPLDRARITTAAPNVRYLYRGTETPDTVQALDIGAEMARGERLGLIPSATGAASGGLLRSAQAALDLAEPALAIASNGSDDGAVFCSRRRFVELGGFGGVSDLRHSPAGGAACVTLAGEGLAAPS